LYDDTNLSIVVYADLDLLFICTLQLKKMSYKGAQVQNKSIKHFQSALEDVLLNIDKRPNESWCNFSKEGLKIHMYIITLL